MIKIPQDQKMTKITPKPKTMTQIPQKPKKND